MKILVTGSGGRVGSRLADDLESAGHELTRWGREDVDFSLEGALESALRELAGNSPDAVINCAAISSIEGCLDDPLRTHRVNAMAPGILARFCERYDIRFIHLSTDYVLDGRRAGKKTERDKCKPVNLYGESKLEAELRIQESCPSAVIARVSWVFGNPACPSFPESILGRALAGEPIQAVEDKFSLPTSLATISKAISFLLKPEASGIFHVCDSGGPVSWLEYARAVLDAAETAKLSLKTHDVQGIPLSSMAVFREPRPPHTAMDNNRLADLMGACISHWRDSLSAYIYRL